MKIYTKTGDAGDTGLFGGARVSKASDRVATYGDVDELNSVIGLVRSLGVAGSIDELLDSIQHELFDLGAELATVPGKEKNLGIALLGDTEIERLERAIDTNEANLEPLKNFILPGGVPGAAALHLARTTCRRAERALIALSQKEPIRAELIRYLNRLSDLLFVLARATNHAAGSQDVAWRGRTR